MIRALHVFGRLTRSGGAEKWVLDMLELHDPKVRFDFLISLDDGPLAESVRCSGSVVYTVPFSHSPFPRPWANPYLNGVRQVLKSNRYDVVHVHQFDLAGEILRIAAEMNVPVRVMSVHATVYENPRFYRRLIHRFIGRPWILRYATNILPCSRIVGESFDPSFLTGNSKFRIQYTGIDPTPFHRAVKQREEKRRVFFREFGLPESAEVVGHVGRFVNQKNHRFLISILDELMSNDPDFYAVLLGSGPLHDEIRRTVRELKRDDRIFLPGVRDDVPDMMVALFDVFALPSLYEGFPIAALESLAAGLSVLFSDRVSDELVPFFPARMEHLSLDAPLKVWAEKIRQLASVRKDPAESLCEMEQGPFTIRNSLDTLLEIYGG